MSEKTVETGYVVHVPKGKVFPTKFVRGIGLQATGIDAKTGRESWIYGHWTIGKDIFLTVEEAIAAGEATKLKRIASLRTQLAKLEAMTIKLSA